MEEINQLKEAGPPAHPVFGQYVKAPKHIELLYRAKLYKILLTAVWLLGFGTMAILFFAVYPNWDIACLPVIGFCLMTYIFWIANAHIEGLQAYHQEQVKFPSYPSLPEGEMPWEKQEKERKEKMLEKLGTCFGTYCAFERNFDRQKASVCLDCIIEEKCSVITMYKKFTRHHDKGEEWKE